jgi:hypothetical protein
MKTIANASTTDLLDKAREWNDMTENNEHSEVLCDIALFFEMGSDYVNYFFELSVKDEGLTVEESHARYDKGAEMLQDIRKRYGDTVYNLIMKVL